MTVCRIESIGDERVQNFANLRSKKLRGSKDDWFIVEGRWCVQRLLQSSLSTLSLLVERSKEQGVSAWVESETPVYSLPSEKIQQLVGYPFHRGVLACGLRPRRVTPRHLRFEPKQIPVGLAMLGVSESENVGSMIRTATALGIEHLLFDSRTIDPFSRRAIRVSMGTVFSQRIYQMEDPATDLETLQRTHGIRAIAATLDSGATPIERFKADGRPVILIVGNEANGIDHDIQDLVTDRVTIPMQLGADSLNVAVAAAIFMHSLTEKMRKELGT